MSKVTVKRTAAEFIVNMELPEAVVVAALLGKTTGSTGFALYNALADAVTDAVGEEALDRAYDASANDADTDSIIEAAGLDPS